jgi:hypothetical protein
MVGLKAWFELLLELEVELLPLELELLLEFELLLLPLLLALPCQPELLGFLLGLELRFCLRLPHV